MADSITCAPKVFHVPQCKRNLKLIALMMPFDVALEPVCSAIKTLAANLGLECERADDIWHDSTIIQDVFELIFQSAFVICDFSGRNPNVFYEAGIAHTLGRDVIPIVQNKEDIPFDLQHHRFIKYLPNSEGLVALGTKLSVRIKELIQQSVPTTRTGFMVPIAFPRKKYEEGALFDGL